MKKKEVWTLDGRKKVYLVDDDNHIVEELEDLGPLTENEKRSLLLKLGKVCDDRLAELDANPEGSENKKKSKKSEATDE